MCVRVYIHFSTKGGGYKIVLNLSNIWRKVQIADHLAPVQSSSLQRLLLIVFVWLPAFVLFDIFKLISNVSANGCTHLFQKQNVFEFNVIFVLIEVYIFIQRFDLYSGPVTNCTFVENFLSKAPQWIPNYQSYLPVSRSIKLRVTRFSWHFLTGPGIQCGRLSAFQPGW